MSSARIASKRLSPLVVAIAFALLGCLLLAACSGSSNTSLTTTPGSPSPNPSSTGGTPGGGTSGGGTSGGGTSGGTSGGGTSGGGTSGGSGNPAGPVVYISETTQSFDNTNNVLGSWSGVIEAFALDATSGALTPLNGSPYANSASTGGVMVLAPSGGAAYQLAQQFPPGSCCVGPTALLAFSLDATTGAPTLRQTLMTTASLAGQLLIHPSGNFLYAAPFAADGPGGIGVFTVGSDGSVSFAGTVNTPAFGPIVIDPNGKFLYVSADGPPVAPLGDNPCGLFTTDISGFSINSTTGALTPLAGSPFPLQRQLCEVGHAPNYLTLRIDARAQRLLATDAFNATVSAFAIDASGSLTPLPGGASDSSVRQFTASAIDPLGRFLYIGSTVDWFTGFSLAADATTGSLPLLAAMPVQATPLPNFDEGSNAMAIDPAGSFLFSNENGFTSAFSCCGPDALVEFRIDPNSGTLTQLAPGRLTLAGSVSSIAVAPAP